jgi:hypothetical protein
MKSLIYILISISLLIPLFSAAAHRPVWGEQYGPIEIPDLRTSFAVYRDLDAGQVDVFTFEALAGQDLRAGIQVPAVAGLEAFGVTAALFGPGLPAANPDELPPDYPEDLGALVFPSSMSADFFEPFTQTNYWGRQQVDLSLPANGAYYLLVWQPDGQPGKYVLDTGYEEVFQLADLIRFPVWWLRVHIFFGHGPVLALAGALIFLAVALLVLRGRMQKSNEKRSQTE